MTSRRVEKTIYLVGFMGSGKSSVGRELARLLHRSFLDLDEEISRVTETSIAKVIKERGESEFRRVETECLRAVASQEGAIVATGGGVVLDPKNLDLMGSSGTTVWLDATFDLCWAHVELDRTERPLAPDRETALRRFNERLKFYQSADIHVAIDDSMTTRMIAEFIVDRLEQP